MPQSSGAPGQSRQPGHSLSLGVLEGSEWPALQNKAPRAAPIAFWVALALFWAFFFELWKEMFSSCHSGESSQLSSGCRDLLSWPCLNQNLWFPESSNSWYAAAVPSERKRLIKPLENPTECLQNADWKINPWTKWLTTGGATPNLTGPRKEKQGDYLRLPTAESRSHLEDVISSPE